MDRAGNVYVTGSTVSDDFPVTAGAYQTEYADSDEVFVAKFSPDGSRLLFSTYVGGAGGDVGLSLTVDAAGNSYVKPVLIYLFATTTTVWRSLWSAAARRRFCFRERSSQGHGRPAWQRSTEVARGESKSGVEPPHSTGSEISTGFSYVTGFSGSFGGFFDFPLVNPIQAETDWRAPGAGPPIDAIVFKLNLAGSALFFSSYFGGTRTEDSSGNIAVDAAGRLVFSGYTESTDLPVTPNALQPISGGGLSDAYLVVIDPARKGWEALRYAS